MHSVNSVFCNIGLKLGAKAILDTAKRFGFYERPPLETPADERQPSGLYRNGKLYYPKVDSNVDAGRHGVRPGADARDAAPDGDGRGSDRLRRKAHGASGRRQDRRSWGARRRGSAADAHPPGGQQADGARGRGDDASRRPRGHRNRRADLRLLGRRQDGDGRRRASRARTRRGSSPSPARRRESPPELAIAVVLQNQSGIGGTTAAPIARAVMQAILQRTENP